MLLFRENRLLLIQRRKPPFGFAPPAGHVDLSPSFEAAGIREMQEEVGLHVTELRLIAEGRRENPCRRPGGSWHYWKVFIVSVQGQLQPSKEEVTTFRWCSQDELQTLARRSQQYRSHRLSEESWISAPGLEPVWLDWFSDLGYVTSHERRTERLKFR